MGGEQLNFDSPAIRVRAGFVGRIFYSPARRTFVVASKFRSGPAERSEKDVRVDVVDDGSLINF